MKRQQALILLILILAIAFVFRVYAFANAPFIETDGAVYSRLGKNLVETGQYTFGETFNLGIIFPPGYPFLIGMTNLIVQDLLLAGQLVSFVASMLTVVFLYLVGAALKNREAGLFASLAAAIHPYFILASAIVFTEAVFIFLIVLSLYLFIIATRTNTLRAFLLFGIASGITYLVRPEGILLLVLPLLHFGKSLPRKKPLVACAIVLVVFAFIASPYIYFLYQSTGKFALTGKTNMNVVVAEVLIEEHPFEQTYSLNEEKTQIRRFESPTLSFIQYIMKYPARYASYYFHNFTREFILLGFLLLPVIIPLLFVLISRIPLRTTVLLLTIPILLFALNAGFWIVLRFLFPIVVFLIVLASLGFANTKKLKPAFLVLLLAGSLFLFAYSSLSEEMNPVEHRQAGIFLRGLSPEYESLNVMSRRSWVSFYADARYTTLPYANYTDVIDYARLHDADYIVIAERTLGDLEFYDEWIIMDRLSDKVELVYEDDAITLIKIFKLRHAT